MKNLAGHPVSIFLFRFVLRKNAISFVLNEVIAKDMYPEIDEKMQPLVQACCETLLRYRTKCHGDTIMDGNILTDGCFEVMLSKGLGKHFIEQEKQNLFNDAHQIADLLEEVMERRTKEEKEGTYPGPQSAVRKIQPIQAINKGMESLGEKKQLLDELLFERVPPKPGIKRLSPEDLPDGVVAKRGYDHRGHCVTFEHNKLGELGKIVLVPLGHNQISMEAELTKGNLATFDIRQEIMQEVFSIVAFGMERLAEHKNS